MNQAITNKNHYAVKRARRFRKRAYRDREGLFLVEGLNLLSEAVRSKAVLRELLYVDSRTDEARLIAGQVSEPIPTYKISEGLMGLVSDVVTNQGIVGVLEQVDEGYEEFMPGGDASLLLVADQVRDPGNLGALMRIADAAGAEGFMLTTGSVDLYNPKVVRSAAGSHFHLPLVRGVDLQVFAGDVRKRGMRLWGLDPHSGRSYLEVDYREPTALIVGNESFGLEEEGRRLIDGTVQIQMSGEAESLNVASAAAVVIFEALRQRGQDAGGT
ncbi:MAG: RNA methyltransferase [Actinobacteria bacterium]|nr:RNA methyltransferase [Actinomycetota bacterium]